MPKPAAEIDVADAVTVGAQHVHEVRQQRERVAERIELGDLAADMHVDADDAHAFELGGAGIDLAGAADRNAEFVLGLAGGDLGVGLGIDVGIDADRNVRRAAGAGGDRGEQFKLRLGFDVDAENALFDRERKLIGGLADAGEHDLAAAEYRRRVRAKARRRRRRPRRRRAGQRRDHGLVGIRLHGVADQRIDVGEGVGEHPIVPLQRRARIAIKRRADGLRQRDEIDGFGVQHAVAIGEMMHAACLEHDPENASPRT